MNENGDRRFGVFRVVRGVDRPGCQGAVYRAVCEGAFPGVTPGETVALKTLSVGDDPESLSRFERRVAAIAGIRDDHVVRYRGCFQATGPFQTLNVTVMDWLEGETLKDRLEHQTGGLDADEALKITDGLLAGLAAAQAAGIVHRDVKPGNIFLCRDGSVKLIDFEVSHQTRTAATTLTEELVGSFDYMAPEFATPGFCGSYASDVFAAGVVLHEALTGQVPYVRKTEKDEQADFAFLSRWSHRQDGSSAIRIKSSVKRVLSHADEVLLKALAEDPAERYPTAAAFRTALRTIRYCEVRSATDAYRLLKVVGEGGFGCVYRARARGAGRFVAVKQLKRPEFGDRFRREAHVMRKLDDPAFVRLVDYFELRGVGATGAFLVMDFLPGMPGSSLRDAIRRGGGSPLPFGDVIKAFGHYARALSLMHRLRIYHRDIKPSNLYFPQDDPSAAAIMDLGIARDVSGTATQGQVPGTLDYMPPEVVLGGSRGDAGMDIYALGLCLYEAVSGKTGYPRLPTGPLAFSAFYERARSRRPPVFDAPSIQDRPALLALLREMTAIDPHERLQDAELLRQRLAQVGEEVPGAVPERRLVRRPSFVPSNVPVDVRSEDAATGETAVGRLPVPVFRPSWPAALSLRRLSRKSLLVGGAAAALVMTLVLGWNPILRGIGALASWRSADDGLSAEDLAAAAARDRRLALDEAASVLSDYASGSVTTTAADARASQWKLRWRENANTADICRDKTAAFEQARKEKLARDAAEAESSRQEVARREQTALVSLLSDPNAAFAVCTNRFAAWKAQWRGAIDDGLYASLERALADAVAARKNREADTDRRRRESDTLRTQRLARAAEAVAAAKSVETAYADKTCALAAADRAHAAWRTAWRTVLDVPSVSAMADRIAAARTRRAGWEGGEQVVAECNRYLDNIYLVGPDDVKNWTGLVRQAELTLMKAESVGGVSPAQAAQVRARIASCGRWVVGVIDNKTDRSVDFAGHVVGPVVAATVVFTNGYPSGAAVRSQGCEPIHVRKERFSARVFTVMPRDLDERVCETKAVLPAFPSELACFIDGIERKSGDVFLRRGQHIVRYCRREETYPGVRDYEAKEYAFETHLSGAVDVPSPTGEWQHSSAFRQAKEQASLVSRGKEIETACRRLLDPMPVETRRSRLEEVHGLLSDWQTSSALAVLGVGVEKSLRSAYDAERLRVRGYVTNGTEHAATVVTDDAQVAVPAGAKVLVTFERRWPPEARAEISGYEFVMLPREASAFDGKVFAIRAEKLVPLPVRVEIPSAEEGVKCRVDGAAAEGTAFLRPGEHEVVWTKPDCAEQRMSFRVETATPRALPAPARWQPEGALSGLAAAFRSLNDGAVGAARKISGDIGDIEDSERRREMEDLRRAVELRQRLEKEKTKRGENDAK